MSNEAERSESDKVAVKKSPWGTIGILFSTFAVIVLIVAGYFAYFYLAKSQIQLANTVAQLQSAEKQSDTSDLQKNAETALQSTQKLQEEVDALQQTVAQYAQTQQSNKNSWELAHAEYDVKLANDALQYANNIPLAMTLLKMADDEIRTLADPKYDAIRKALANDIANLNSATQVDVSGIYMRLTALNNQLDKLTLPAQSQNTNASAANESVNQQQSWWEKGLQATWIALQKIVIVRYHQEGVMPLVTPEQQLFLYQNLHAMLAQATWALLHSQPAIYQTSLQQTSEWVKKYFPQESTVTQAVLSELNQLQQINIHPSAPTVKDSLEAFEMVKQH